MSHLLAYSPDTLRVLHSPRNSVRLSGADYPEAKSLPQLELDNWNAYVRSHIDGDRFELFTGAGPLSRPSASSDLAQPQRSTTLSTPDGKSPSIDAVDSSGFPNGFKLGLIICGLFSAIFCVALDTTIIVAAIPRITDQFGSLNDVGWYGSGYLLTSCAFQLFFGKLYNILSIKIVFLSALFIFEIGSLICGVAPTAVAFIVGRAIAGAGSAGLFSGAVIIITHVVPLKKAPTFISLMAGIYGVAAVIGPPLGGVFTEKATWHWCFYINLPLGFISSVIIVFVLTIQSTDQEPRPDWVQAIKQLDFIGTAFFVPSVICLLLALQWGGATYPWDDWRIIVLFVSFAILLILFIADQIWQGELATVPPRIATQRSMAFGFLFIFCLGSSYFVIIYYLPIWFQAIKGDSTIQSGLNIVPFIIANVIGLVISGSLTTRFGYYMPFVILSVIFMSIGSGLLSTFKSDTSTVRWAAYEIIFGFGTGFGFQQSAVAAQTVLPFADTPIGTTIQLFALPFGGTAFVSIAQNIFTTNLVKGVLALNIPGVDSKSIIKSGATQLRNSIPAEHLPQIIQAYNASLAKVFQLGLIMACLSIIGAAGMEWKSVKAEKNPSPIV